MALRHPDADVRAIRRGRGGIVVVAFVSGLVLKPRVLPACTVAAALADELQVAAETLKTARRAERRGNLSLKARFGFVARATGCFWNRQRNRTAVFGIAAVACGNKHCSNRD